MLFLVKPALEGKLPVCRWASNSLLRMSRKTAGSSTYANTSVILTVLRGRPVYVFLLGGLNGLEVKVHTVGNCKPSLEKSAKQLDKEQSCTGINIYLCLGTRILKDSSKMWIPTACQMLVYSKVGKQLCFSRMKG